MNVAAHILGTELGSTNPVFVAVLAVHVPAGLTAVISGATAALSTNGSRRHRFAGRCYYYALIIVAATALALTAMRPRQDYHLALIGLVAFTAATVGYQHRRRHRPGDSTHIIGMGLAYIAMLTAFYVDNGPHLPIWNHLPTFAFWLLPTVIGAPITVRALHRASQHKRLTLGGSQRGHVKTPRRANRR